ncbi:MAG: HAMP domain-containing sensor histidine kinase [Thalassobaculum sp.]|uniref:sensor histidine kinase n=1 Tax=Thalassobaculum sp. TaxID=2022740 RepID=UPI0032F0567D
MTTELPPAERSQSEARPGLSGSTPATDIAVVRRTLRRLTLVVTTVVLFSIPALFALAGIRALHEHAVLDAAVTAQRVADHATTAGAGWRQAPKDLLPVLDLTPTMGIQVERTLLGPEGGVLMTPTAPVARPVLRSRASVMLDGTRLGEVVVAVSLRAILIETALVFGFAALVAAGLHLVIDRVALRALRQALDHLQAALRERDRALQETSDALALLGRQNARLKTTSEELSRARDAALTADRSKSMFLAAMSHELRTPLNAIIGFSEVMARQLYGPIGHDKYRDYAADIRASGDHLLALIDDVLDLSRVEAGKLSLRREPLDVVEQVEGCCRLVNGRAVDAGIDLQCVADNAADPRILGDRVRFRQILLNLLTNAVKFTERGGLVRVETETGPDRAVTVRITDTGIGMSSVDLERVFRPFERVDVGASRPTEGAGLGLALSRALVREHDGELHVSSVPGQGTVVTLTFPGLTGRSVSDQRRQMSLEDALRDDDAAAL